MSGVDPTTGEVLPEGAEPDDRSPGEIVAELHEKLIEARLDLSAAKDLLVKEKREVQRLRRELDEQMAQANETPMVKTIYHAWVNATGRNPKRTKLGPARTKAVLARIREGRDFDYILRAATIGAQAANVSDREGERLALLAAMRHATELLPEPEARKVRETYRQTVGSVTKYDDLELICRNEVNLERFAALADRIDPEGTQRLLDAGV